MARLVLDAFGGDHVRREQAPAWSALRDVEEPAQDEDHAAAIEEGARADRVDEESAP